MRFPGISPYYVIRDQRGDMEHMMASLEQISIIAYGLFSVFRFSQLFAVIKVYFKTSVGIF